MTMTAGSGETLEIALVNNMPDQALAPTQAQFSRLVREAAGGREIRWRCYTLPGAERSETAQRYLEKTHEDIEALYRRGADALIVTGCEPRAARLDEEPYWPRLQYLIDWARTHTVSSIWSCLAAHAAALHVAGIERRRLPKKVSGVYSAQRLASFSGSPIGGTTIVPHSRCNEIDRRELEAKGFTIGSVSPQVGVDVFWREEPSLFVFLQGHPEYDSESLAKEYRRDFMRFLNGERDDCPDQPENVFSPETMMRLDALRRCATSYEPSEVEAWLADILSRETPDAAWASHSARLYEEWLQAVSERVSAWRHSA